jgi:sugar lactone lactonase YvrE
MKFLLLFLVLMPLVQADYEVTVFLGKEADAKYKGTMDYPFGVEFDSKENMYIVEYDGSSLDILKADGTFVKLGGDGSRNFTVENGPVKGAKFNGLHNVIIDDKDQVYITDTFNNLLRQYDYKTGNISNHTGQLAKGFDDGPRLKSKFNQLYCAAWGPGKAKIYIADLKNQRVRSVDMKSGAVSTVAGNGKKGIPKDGSDALKSPLVDPRAVGVDSKGNVYIADRGGHALRVLKPDGKIYTLVNKKGKKGRALGNGPEAQLYGPKYVAVDKDDKVYIADDQNHRICVYDPETKQLTSLIGNDSKLKGWSIKRPHGVTIHKDGSIYVVDSGNDRILKMVKK